MSWQGIELAEKVQTLQGRFWRVVESQEQVATVEITDNLAEQAALEALLEAEVKPKYPQNVHGLHYLFSTPFRYPPLRDGSRFGTRIENSLYYGAKDLPVALAETAYYRFVFRRSIAAPAPTEVLQSRHTSFSGKYRTELGLALQNFGTLTQQLAHPSDYELAQSLGKAARKAGVEALEYRSARAQGINVAFYYPHVIHSAKPCEMGEWICHCDDASVALKSLSSSELYEFPLSQFIVAGKFPLPA